MNADPMREAVRDAIAEALGDAYDCTRVWAAWSCSTMGPDDFALVREDSDRLDEIADAALKAMARKAEHRAQGELFGFSREDLADLAEGLEADPQTIDVGPLEFGFANSRIESAAGAAARFIRTVLAAKQPAQGEAVWRNFPEQVPDPGTECLVEAEFNGGRYRAVDTWEMQSEAPVGWSSATLEAGYDWSSHPGGVQRWIPISGITAVPAPSVPDQAP